LSDEYDDPILDAGLDEVLGGVTPPDLSDPIAHALESGQIPEHVVLVAQSIAPLAPSASPSVAPPPVVGAAGRVDAPMPRVRARLAVRHDRRRIHLQWLAATISLSLVVAAGTYLLTRSTLNDQSRSILRESDVTASPKSISSGAKDAPSARRQRPSIRSRDKGTKPLDSSDPKLANHEPADRGGNDATKGISVEPKSTLPPEPQPVQETIASSAARLPQRELIAAIDQQIRAGWTAAGLRPSGEATDAEWCRRVFLGVIGRVPSVTELEAFLQDRRPNKKAQLLDRLLTADPYTQEYARHWSSLWTTLLVGRANDEDPDRLADRSGLQQYLRRVFAENRPLDRVAYELLTATGSSKPGMEDFNGATNFLLAHSDSRGVQASAKTAQVFLGRQIQCMQCHNHPFYDGKAHQFWELAAFFRQTKAERIAGTDAARLIDRDFIGDSGDAEHAETYWETQTGLMKAAYPVFLDGTTVSKSGRVQQINRRAELAKLITRSPMLSEALVNRVWEHFFGRGFTTQVDDMGPHASVSHPALLALLSEQFSAHAYDLRSLVRWISLSQAYGLSSRFNKSNKRDDLATEDPPLFSRYYLRQMQPEQIYESLAVFGGDRERLGDVAQLDRSRSQWVGQLALSFKTDDCTECTLWDGSIPQTLLMMNGDLTDQATQVDKNSFLRQVERMEGSITKKVQRLFLAAVARLPSATEMQAAHRLIAARNGQVGPALEDLWWALLNSNEFIMDR
jgi:hypothetical protein